MSKVGMNQNIFNAIQRLKDGALKHGGNEALQDAVDIQMWLQQFGEAEAESKPDPKKEKPPKLPKKRLKKAPPKPGRKRK